MSRFPDLLDAHRCALFEIVEAFRKHDLEGRAVRVSLEVRAGLGLLMGKCVECVNADLDTLRVLDEAGYVTLTDTSMEWPDGIKMVTYTLILKKLASDYYDWAHRPAVYRSLSGFWHSLRPFVLPALLSSIFTLLVWIILNWLFGRGPSTVP